MIRRPWSSARARVRLLLFDVDGVLTDGKILLHADGSETKRFDIRDGTAIVLAQRAGLDGRACYRPPVGGDDRAGRAAWHSDRPCRARATSSKRWSEILAG